MRRWLPAAGISGLFFLAGIAGFPGTAAAAAGPAPGGAKAAPAKTGPAAPAAAASAPEPAASAPTPEAQPAKAQPAKAQPAKAQPAKAQPAKAGARSEAGTAARSQAAPPTSRSATSNVKASRAEARRAAVAAAAAEQPTQTASTTPTKAERAKARAAAEAKAKTAAEAAAAATEVAPTADAAAPVTAASNHVTAICHATGTATAPFELVEIATSAVPAHLAHGDRLPVGGACPGPTPPPAPTDVLVCHATASAATPFELITIPASALPAHLAHGDRLPVGGVCPGPTPPPPAPDVLVCHATATPAKPFELITIPAAALPAHLAHGDRLPVNGACPGPTPPPPTPDVSICHATGAPATPFQLINIPAAALPEHLAHGDRLPVQGACPSGTGTPPPAADVVICHATGSATTPFELLTIPASALPGHLAHGDRLPQDGACPGATQPPPAQDVLVCHATGSAAAPFVLLTVPFATLPAHLGHGDRLPTGGACPGAGVTPPPPDVLVCHATGSAAEPFVPLTIPSAALPAHLGHGDRLPANGACPGALPRVPDDVLSNDDARDDDDADEVATVVATRPPTVEAQFVSIPILVNLDGLSSLPATGFDAGFAALLGLLLLVAGVGLTRFASARATARSTGGGSRPGSSRPPRFGSARGTARTTIVSSRRGHGLHRRAGRLSLLRARVLTLVRVVPSRFRVSGLLLPDP